jgi:hypothetical protein
VTLPGAESGHVHSSVLARWDQVMPGPCSGSLGDLILAGVRAAVLAPEAELGSWFSFTERADAALVDGLVAEGRLLRPAPGWLAVS